MTIPAEVTKALDDITVMSLSYAQVLLDAMTYGDNDQFSPMIMDALKARIAELS